MRAASPDHCQYCGCHLPSRSTEDRQRVPHIVVDLNVNCVRIGDKVISMTARQAEVLYALVQRAGRVIHADALNGLVWGEFGEEVQSETVKHYIMQLRRILAGTSCRIDTHPRCGWRIPRECVFPPAKPDEGYS